MKPLPHFGPIRHQPISALLRRICSKCRQSRELRGGKVRRVGIARIFTCAECLG